MLHVKQLEHFDGSASIGVEFAPVLNISDWSNKPGDCQQTCVQQHSVSHALIDANSNIRNWDYWQLNKC